MLTSANVLTKIATTKSIKRDRSLKRQKSSLNQPSCLIKASKLIVSTGRSILAYRRSLVKHFSASFTPKKQSKIEKNIDIPCANKDQINKKTIFLDLDETLVHCTRTKPKVRFDFTIKLKIRGQVIVLFVVKRPGLDHFLEKIGEKYEVVVFTAGIEDYANAVLDKIDKKGVISHRLFRDSCHRIDGRNVKDLAATGRDLAKVVIVDDNPNAYAWQPENALPIKPFLNDMKDVELSKLVAFFDDCIGVEDTRVALKKFNQLKKKLRQS